MSEKPILFSGPMVGAILDGRKTQTRRVLKPQPGSMVACAVDVDGVWAWRRGDDGSLDGRINLPYAVGDQLFISMEIPSLGRNYCADLFGTIWSRARDGETWRRLKPSKTSRGYMSVTPAVNGVYRTRTVHRLVAEAFYGPAPEPGWQVRHLDGDQANNAPHNLDWGTQQQNWTDRLVHGRGTGGNHHSSKLSADAVDQIRRSVETQRELAQHFGVTQSTIWAIQQQKTWQENPVADPPTLARWTRPEIPEVTGVRVERVQDISEADALAEGVEIDPVTCAAIGAEGVGGARRLYGFARSAFRDLWDSLNAKRGYGWDANPWVAVIEFRRTT